MNKSKKRTFELTAAFAMGNLLGKLMANKTFSAVPELSDRSRARIEELIASASASKDMTESVVKETDPEFWDELSGLESFKGKLAIIEFMDRKLKEKKRKGQTFRRQENARKNKGPGRPFNGPVLWKFISDRRAFKDRRLVAGSQRNAGNH